MPSKYLKGRQLWQVTKAKGSSWKWNTILVLATIEVLGVCWNLEGWKWCNLKYLECSLGFSVEWVQTKTNNWQPNQSNMSLWVHPTESNKMEQRKIWETCDSESARDMIQRRIDIKDKGYILCEPEEETLMHIFIDCPILKIIQAFSLWPIKFFEMQFNFIIDWIRTRCNQKQNWRCQKSKKETSYYSCLFVVIY